MGKVSLSRQKLLSCGYALLLVFVLFTDMFCPCQWIYLFLLAWQMLLWDCSLPLSFLGPPDEGRGCSRAAAGSGVEAWPGRTKSWV